MKNVASALAIAAALYFGLMAAGADAQTRSPRGGASGAVATRLLSSAVVLNGADRAAAIAQANAALNAQRTMQGRFVQVAPDGSRATGSFYLQRPGRLRFEYDPPASLLIISDGRVVSMRDTQLRTTERTPLESTPLRLILAEQIDLARDARITRVAREGAALLISARDRTAGTEGEITLRFEGADGGLRSWEVIDATGGRTQIALTGVSHPASLDRNLFRLEDVLENRPGRRR
jgi:outer membrane lipoprotein-sorting protein